MGLAGSKRDRKSTRLNSSHANIYTLSLHDALPISTLCRTVFSEAIAVHRLHIAVGALRIDTYGFGRLQERSEEHTSELQSRQYLHSFPTRRSSDLHSLPDGVFGSDSRSPASYSRRSLANRHVWVWPAPR